MSKRVTYLFDSLHLKSFLAYLIKFFKEYMSFLFVKSIDYKMDDAPIIGAKELSG